MEKQAINLNKGIQPMSALEMEQVDGGGWLEVAAWVGMQIVANWAEVKKGAIAGWNSVHYN